MASKPSQFQAVKGLIETLGLNVDVDPEMFPEGELKQLRSRQAEAVLAYIDNPARFTKRECKMCGGVFLVDLDCVGYCNDWCRKKALANNGISWDPNKTQWDRWQRKIPLVLPEESIPLAREAMERRQNMIDNPEFREPVPEPLPVVTTPTGGDKDEKKNSLLAEIDQFLAS